MKSRFPLFAFVALILSAASIQASDPSLVIDSGGNTRYIKRVIFTKDGDQLVSVGDDKVIRVWDIKSGRTVRTIRDQVGICAECTISMIALSPDNNYLAVGGKFPGADVETRFAIYIYNFKTGERLQLLKGHKAKVIALAFSPEGNQLASGSAYYGEDQELDSDGPVRVWNVGPQRWQPAAKFQGHTDAVSSLAFSPDGERLVSGSHDNDVRLWKLKQSLPEAGIRLEKHHNGEIYGVAFSPDGRYLISAGLDRKINLWDAQGKFLKELAQPSGGVTSMEFSPNKNRPAVLVGLENGTSRLLSVPDGAVINSFKGSGDKVWTVTFSRANENLIASSGGFNGEVWLWQADSGKTFGPGVLAGSGKSVWSVGFAKDGNSIAFGTQHTADVPNNYSPLHQVVRLRPSESSKLEQQGAAYRISLGGKVASEADYVTALVKSGEYELRTRYGQTLKRRIGPDQFIDEPVRLDELQIFKSGQRIETIKRDQASGRTYKCFTFTGDGRYIVSGGEGGYLALYESKTGRLLHKFVGHTNDVWAVAVSPNGRFVVSGSSDQTIKLWDIKSEQYLLSIFVASDSEWVAWNPQGYYTSSLNGDRYFGWQVELAANNQPKFYNAAQFSKIFYRPDVISEYVATPDIQTAMEQANRSPRGSLQSMAEPAANVVFHAQDFLQTLPPKIQILAPADKATVNERLLPVKVIVTSENLPITEVNISLNGFRRGTFKGNPSGKDKSQKVEVETVIALEPEENTLVVVASHEKASSEPEVRTIFYKPRPKQETPIRPNPQRQVMTEVQPVISAAAARQPVSIDEGSLGVRYLRASAANTLPPASSRDDLTRSARPNNPPRLEIISPEDTGRPLDVAEDSITIRVRVQTDSPGTTVRVFLNGVKLHEQNIDPGVSQPIQIPLETEGENVLSVVAISGGVESAPQTRRIDFRNPTPERPNLIFLGIGIKGYSKFDPKLEFADKDAEDVGRLLCRLNNSSLFKGVQAHLLSNEHATRENILKEIDWLNKQAMHDNDVRVLLVSGHGGIVGQRFRQYYFFTQNQDPAEDPEVLSANWQTILTRLMDGGHGPILLFVDTCRSGEASPKDFMDVKDANGLVFFGASESNENSKENASWGGHGAFTQAVLEGLSGSADQAFDSAHPKDGKIDFLELNSWIQLRVSELNGSQHPSFDLSRGLRRFNIAVVPISTTPDPQTTCPKDPTP